jgi:hypothetical protein
VGARSDKKKKKRQKKHKKYVTHNKGMWHM